MTTMMIMMMRWRYIFPKCSTVLSQHQPNEQCSNPATSSLQKPIGWWNVPSWNNASENSVGKRMSKVWVVSCDGSYVWDSVGLVETWEEPGVNLTASRLSAELGGTERNAAEPSRSGGAGNPAELGRNLAETWRNPAEEKEVEAGWLGTVSTLNHPPFDLRVFRRVPRGFRQVSAAGFLPPGFRWARLGSTRFLPVAGCCRVAPGFRQRGSSSRLPLQCAFFCRVSS